MGTQFPKTAIFGAIGLLGKEFFSTHREVYPDCVGTTQYKNNEKFAYFDLRSSNVSELNLYEYGHRDALIFSGISKISTCEKEFEATKEVNLDGTLKLIKQCVSEGIKPIFFSSDQVFDGETGQYSDDEVLHPLNNYGKFKAEIEEYMKGFCNGKYLIIRLCKIFTLEKNSGTILDEMAAMLTTGKVVHAANDQIFNLTYLGDVIDVVSLLQTMNACGVYNVCSPEVWSRYDLAIEMARKLSVNEGQIKKISLDDLGESFNRPKNTSMCTEKLNNDVNYKFTSIDECISKIAKDWMLVRK